MADIGGYTGIPDTLPEAQQMIVRLFDEQKRNGELQSDSLHTLNKAVRMIEAAREALNIFEKT